MKGYKGKPKKQSTYYYLYYVAQRIPLLSDIQLLGNKFVWDRRLKNIYKISKLNFHLGANINFAAMAVRDWKLEIETLLCLYNWNILGNVTIS